MKQKGNKLSAYWTMRLFLEKGLYSPFIAFLMMILVGSEKLNASTVFWVLTSLFLLYCIGKLANTVNVLVGKFDIEQFHEVQKHLCVVLGFSGDGKLLFATLVSDFEAKILYAMQRREWLYVKGKRVDLIETYNYNELSKEERNTLYIDRTDQDASVIIYRTLLSDKHKKILMQDIESLTINGSYKVE